MEYSRLMLGSANRAIDLRGLGRAMLFAAALLAGSVSASAAAQNQGQLIVERLPSRPYADAWDNAVLLQLMGSVVFAGAGAVGTGVLLEGSGDDAFVIAGAVLGLGGSIGAALLAVGIGLAVDVHHRRRRGAQAIRLRLSPMTNGAFASAQASF